MGWLNLLIIRASIMKSASVWGLDEDGIAFTATGCSWFRLYLYTPWKTSPKAPWPSGLRYKIKQLIYRRKKKELIIYIYIFFKKLSLNPEIEYHCGYWWSLNLYLPYQSYTFAWDLRQVFKTIKISSELVVRIEFGHYSVGNSLQRR